MALLISLTDPGMEFQVVYRVSQGYNPDILDDMKRRLIETYKEVLELRMAMNALYEEEEETEGPEPESGMDAPV